MAEFTTFHINNETPSGVLSEIQVQQLPTNDVSVVHLLPNHVIEQDILSDMWNQLLEEVNHGDLEDIDFDSVRMMIENELTNDMIVALSIRYGNGDSLESRNIHIRRIMDAVRVATENARDITSVSYMLQTNECAVHFIQNAVDDGGGTECPICYEDIANIQTVRLGCNHDYCSSCLIRHMDKNKLNCPMCREQIQHITVRQQQHYDAVCTLLEGRNVIDDDDDDDIPGLISDSESEYEELLNNIVGGSYMNNNVITNNQNPYMFINYNLPINMIHNDLS